MSNSTESKSWRNDDQSPICKLDNNGNLNLNIKRDYTLECIIPKLNLPVGCNDYNNKILLYKSKNKHNNSSEDEQNIKKKKIGLSDLSLDLQRILKDVEQLIDKEFNNKSFGQVLYNKDTKKLDFYSEYDTDRSEILGEVDFSETIEEVENKIPTILINDDILEIEQGS